MKRKQQMNLHQNNSFVNQIVWSHTPSSSGSYSTDHIVRLQRLMKVQCYYGVTNVYLYCQGTQKYNIACSQTVTMQINKQRLQVGQEQHSKVGQHSANTLISLCNMNSLSHINGLSHINNTTCDVSQENERIPTQSRAVGLTYTAPDI